MGWWGRRFHWMPSHRQASSHGILWSIDLNEMHCLVIPSALLPTHHFFLPCILFPEVIPRGYSWQQVSVWPYLMQHLKKKSHTSFPFPQQIHVYNNWTRRTHGLLGREEIWNHRERFFYLSNPTLLSLYLTLSQVRKSCHANYLVWDDWSMIRLLCPCSCTDGSFLWSSIKLLVQWEGQVLSGCSPQSMPVLMGHCFDFCIIWLAIRW